MSKETVDCILDVAVAVIEKEGRYLISQRMPNDSFGGIWEFPGGKAEPEESLEDCLAREMKEELGIVVEVGKKLREITHRYPTRTIRLHPFACRIIEGEPSAIECAAWRWVSPSELSGFQFPPASGSLIAQLQTS